MLADLLAAALLLVICGYAVLGGADFGGGVIAPFTPRGVKPTRYRHAITTVMGPVWEANHVWLVVVVVGFFTVFPSAYRAMGIALFVPFIFALVGIALRGSSFVFESHVQGFRHVQSSFGALFSAGSVLAPFMFGTVAGAMAVGDVRLGAGNAIEFPGVIAIWTGALPLVSGFLAVALCGFLAATYLTREMVRSREEELAEAFRVRALAFSAVAGALSVAGLAVAASDAPRHFDRLFGPALPAVIVAILCGLAAPATMYGRRYSASRLFAALAVVVLIVGWGVALYPWIIGPDLTIASAHATEPMMIAFLVAVIIGLVILVPCWAILYGWFRREPFHIPEE